MEQAVSDSEAPRRFNTAIISAFAFVALLLAALGIYSVIAFSAALRVQEMAIRLALGSQRSGILSLIFGSAAKLAMAGCALGLLGAAAASRLLHSFLFGVSPFDPRGPDAGGGLCADSVFAGRVSACAAGSFHRSDEGVADGLSGRLGRHLRLCGC